MICVCFSSAKVYRICAAVIMMSTYRSVLSLCCGDSFFGGRSDVAISCQDFKEEEEVVFLAKLKSIEHYIDEDMPCLLCRTTPSWIELLCPAWALTLSLVLLGLFLSSFFWKHDLEPLLQHAIRLHSLHFYVAAGSTCRRKVLYTWSLRWKKDLNTQLPPTALFCQTDVRELNEAACEAFANVSR